MYDKNNSESFSDRLRECLSEQNLTQVELAARAEISKHTITKYLRAGRSPRADIASKLAAVLGVDAAWLLYGQGYHKTVAKESLIRPKEIPDDVSFDLMHDIIEEFAVSSDPDVRKKAVKIFKQAFGELYGKMVEKEQKYYR